VRYDLLERSFSGARPTRQQAACGGRRPQGGSQAIPKTSQEVRDVGAPPMVTPPRAVSLNPASTSPPRSGHFSFRLCGGTKVKRRFATPPTADDSPAPVKGAAWSPPGFLCFCQAGTRSHHEVSLDVSPERLHGFGRGGMQSSKTRPRNDSSRRGTAPRSGTYSLSPRNRDRVEKAVMDRGVDLTCSRRNLGRGALVAFDPVGL